MREPGTVLAFDFGLKRIGVAIGESALGTARALGTIEQAATDARFGAIESLLREWTPQQLVVGLPCNDDGSPSEMTERCRRFANQLHGRFGLPVALVDERYTSLEADAALRDQGHDWRARKNLLDAHAACIILESWFADHDRTAQG